MKVRLMGIAQECSILVDGLLQLPFRVVSVSEPYPCRSVSELVRVYVEMRLTDAQIQNSGDLR